VQAATANLEKSADAIVADTGKRNQQLAKGRTLTKQEFMLFRGWIGYYYMADMKLFLQETEQWYHRRLRSYIWKSWKRVRTRFKNLMRCGISRWWAWQWANTRKGYWRIADSPILHRAISNERLASQGYPSLVGIYSRLHRN